jgi:TrkA domain protein
MTEIQETLLPGVGVRHELTTAAGERLSVLTHRDGRRELALYDQDDRDTCHTVLHLRETEAATVAELLGATVVSAAARAVQRLEGVALGWIEIPASSAFAGLSVGEGRLRTETGASIVAIVRGNETIPAPGPQDRLAVGDTVVAVGTDAGLDRLRALLTS